MTFCGIDPGLDGCLAVIEETGQITFWDVPTLESVPGRREYDLPAIVDLLLGLPVGDILVGIEKVHAMPKNGSIANFSMGVSFGMWTALLTAAETPFEIILPTRWKKLLMADQGKTKDASRQVATRLFPQAAAMLNLKKHHNRADALLIAEYMRRTHGGNPT
jgi:crossover junction endodeoxyribonuclease RuvC